MPYYPCMLILTRHSILSGFGELESSDNVSFSLHGILCGDTPDPDPATNMTAVFKSVISASRTVSHMCAFSTPFKVLSYILSYTLTCYSWCGLALRFIHVRSMACAFRRAVHRSIQPPAREQDHDLQYARTYMHQITHYMSAQRDVSPVRPGHSPHDRAAPCRSNG